MLSVVVAAWGGWLSFQALKPRDDVDAEDAAVRKLLRFWACFAFLVAYDAYAAWLFSWIPGYSLARAVRRRPRRALRPGSVLSASSGLSTTSEETSRPRAGRRGPPRTSSPSASSSEMPR